MKNSRMKIFSLVALAALLLPLAITFGQGGNTIQLHQFYVMEMN